MGRKKNLDLYEIRRQLQKGETMDFEEIGEVILYASKISPLRKHSHNLGGIAWACYFAICWLFGKRISEIVELRTADISITDTDLAIRFRVRKKKGKALPSVRKLITLENPYTEYVLRHYQRVMNSGGGYLFPAPGTKNGHIYPKYVWDVIQLMKEDGLKQPIWSHLFRTSLATEMAVDRGTASELKDWFDWENIATADEYVKKAGHLSERQSKRLW